MISVYNLKELFQCSPLPGFSFLLPFSSPGASSGKGPPPACQRCARDAGLQWSDTDRMRDILPLEHRRTCSGCLLLMGNTRWHTTTAVLLFFWFGSQKFVSMHQPGMWLKRTEQNMSLSTLLNPTGQITFPIKFHPSYSVRVIFLFITLPNLAASESKQILYLAAC